MAALLAMFHPVPPVIRRRARELLETIKKAVAEALGEGAATADAALETTTDGIPTGESEMAVDGDDADATVATATNLWTGGKGSPRHPAALLPNSHACACVLATPVAQAARTSLLGGVQSQRGAPVFAAPQSALLGPRTRTLPSSSGVSRTADFARVVARIHSALVVAPTAPRVCPGVPVASADESGLPAAGPAEEEEEPANVEGQAEVAFVPAAQRAVREVIADEALVVVGQRKKRKRVDRERKRSSDGAPAGTPIATAAEEEEIAPFDYASAPNLLDEGMEELARAQEASGAGGGNRGKKRKKDKAPMPYGDFPAPPRDKREVKGGSKAMTFR
jgi:exosome complex exonuclease RRP6